MYNTKMLKFENVWKVTTYIKKLKKKMRINFQLYFSLNVVGYYHKNSYEANILKRTTFLSKVNTMKIVRHKNLYEKAICICAMYQ